MNNQWFKLNAVSFLFNNTQRKRFEKQDNMWEYRLEEISWWEKLWLIFVINNWPKTQSVFKFSHNLSALSQMDPPHTDEVSGKVDIFVRSLGQVDLWSDVPPRMRLWVRLTFGQTFGQADLWSGVLPDRDILWLSVLLLQVRLTFVRHTPPQWGFRSGCHLVRLHVRMTFGQMYPSQDEASAQVDIWSDFGSGWP